MPEQPKLGCETPCVTRMYLAQLAGQCKPADTWLQGVGSEYSGVAVVTAERFYRVDRPFDDPEYGNLRDLDSNDWFVSELTAGLRRGDHLTPEEISRLREMATVRNTLVTDFHNLPPAEQVARREQTRPFLDRVVCNAMHDTLEPQTYDFRAIGFGVVPAPHLPLRGSATLENLHGHDQRPFEAAALALRNCGGMMLHTRRSLPFLGQRATTTVCPNGERDNRYYRAQYQTAKAPQDVVSRRD